MATTRDMPGWRSGCRIRVLCDSTDGVRGEYEVTVGKVVPLGCGCTRLETDRPGPPRDGREHMNVRVGRCSMHEDHAPVLVSKGTLTIRHTRPEGTVAEGTARGDGAGDILSRYRFRWGRSMDLWYIRGSRDRAADLWSINKAAEALRAASWTVEVVIDETPRAFATAEAARYDRAEDRAEHHSEAAGRAATRADARWEAARGILGSIPPGQPILVGHHSEGRHRRDLARADGHERASIAEGRKADYHANRAEASANHQRHRENLPTTLRRIKRLTADRARIERMLAEPARVFGPITQQQAAWRAAREADLIQFADEIAYWEKHVAEREAAGEKVWGPDDFKPGDIAYVGTWPCKVIRVNKKSLTVPALIGGDATWNDRVPYDKITDRVPAGAAAEKKGQG